MRATGRREEIERLLSRGKAEGRTYAELAAEAGIKPSTLACWAWRLRRERQAKEPVDGASEVRPQFIELAAAAGRSEVRVEIELKSGRRVVTTSNVDARTLAALVEALDPC